MDITRWFSPRGTVLSPGKHLAISGDIFVVMGVGVLLASSGERPQCTGRPSTPPTKNYQSPDVNSARAEKHCSIGS